MRQYWREHGLQTFRWGGGLVLPDVGQRSSYRLCQVLLHRLQFLPSFRQE